MKKLRYALLGWMAWKVIKRRTGKKPGSDVRYR
jgi:hypothetical protein